MAGTPYWGNVTYEDIHGTNPDGVPVAPVQRETVVARPVFVKPVSGPQIPTRDVVSEGTLTALPPSYSWGFPTGGNWSSVAPDEKVNAGDVLRFTHRLKIPFLEQWQTDRIVSKFQEDRRFQLLYFALNEETRTLVIEAQTHTSFSPVPLVAAAVVIILAGAFVWVTTIGIERIGKSPLVPAINGLVFAGIGIVAIFLLSSFSRIRGAG